MNRSISYEAMFLVTCRGGVNGLRPGDSSGSSRYDGTFKLNHQEIIKHFKYTSKKQNKNYLIVITIFLIDSINERDAAQLVLVGFEIAQEGGQFELIESC